MSRSRRSKRTKSKRGVVSSYSSSPSRRVKREKKKVVSQSIVMIFLAIVLLLVFIFVIIPVFFNFITNFLNSSSPFQETDDIPPQIPIISAPVIATNSAQLNINGFGEPESTVVFIINGDKEDEIVIAEDGSFEIPVTLSEGENKISAYSVDEAENESSVTREYLTILDTEAPSLELIEPEDGAEFKSRIDQSITIKGTTDEESDVKVYINNRLVFPKTDGSFSHTYRLDEGENKLEIKAQDKAGNSNQMEVTYNFNP